MFFGGTPIPCQSHIPPCLISCLWVCGHQTQSLEVSDESKPAETLHSPNNTLMFQTAVSRPEMSGHRRRTGPNILVVRIATESMLHVVLLPISGSELCCVLVTNCVCDMSCHVCTTHLTFRVLCMINSHRTCRWWCCWRMLVSLNSFWNELGKGLDSFSGPGVNVRILAAIQVNAKRKRTACPNSL